MMLHLLLRMMMMMMKLLLLLTGLGIVLLQQNRHRLIARLRLDGRRTLLAIAMVLGRHYNL